MTSKRNPGVTRTLLIALNLTLLTLVGFIWHRFEAMIHEPQHLKAHELALPDLAVLLARTSPTVDVATIRDNAVFHNRRSFYEAPPPSQILPTPDYDLAGTLKLPTGRRIAFVKRKSDLSNNTLHVGEELDGWQVQSIDAATVVLVRGDQRLELKSAVPASSAGLGYGDSTPRVAQSVPRVLGGQGPGASPTLPDPSKTPRLYRPPPL